MTEIDEMVAVLICLHRGDLTEHVLSGNLNYTDRYLRKKFFDSYEISPKKHSGIVRFQHTVEIISKNLDHLNFTEIAAGCGYYDLSHFTREFKKYSGTTPTGFSRSLDHLYANK